MNGVLTLICLIVCAVIVLAVPGFVSPWGGDLGIANVFDTGRAVLLCAALAGVAGLIISRQPEGREFLLRLFIFGLLVRMILGTAIFVFRGQEFFGGDAYTYDFLGFAQTRSWAGDRYYWSVVNAHIGHSGGTGWGMIYLVAAIYALIG